MNPAGADISPLLREILTRVSAESRAAKLPCYLVGGWLRDQLLHRRARSLNVDLAVPQRAMAFAQDVARILGGAYVPLDDAAGCARVVLTQTEPKLELDLSDFRGPSLEEDLRRRDFTLNAIAIALEDWIRDPTHPHPFIDPLGGQQALARRQLLPCFPGTFTDDPVRILRGFRFVVQLGCALDPAALPLMKDALPGLATVSGERIRDELMAIFDTDQASVAVRSLEALGAFDMLLPELIPGRGMDQGGYHHLDVLGHQLEAVAQADRILASYEEFSAPLREPLLRYCAEEPVERRSRKALIKLAALLHDVGKPARRTVEPDGEIWFLGHEETGAVLVPAITERLKLSNREATMVERLVRHHLRPGFLSREPQLTRRAIYRFFKDLEDDGPGCLLTWWADRMATRGPQSRLDQVDQQRARLEELFNAYFFTAEEVVKPPRLITGHQLMDALRLPPGPMIGTLLGLIEEAQAEGRVRSAEEALQLARAHLSQRRPP